MIFVISSFAARRRRRDKRLSTSSQDVATRRKRWAMRDKHFPLTPFCYPILEKSRDTKADMNALLRSRGQKNGKNTSLHIRE